MLIVSVLTFFLFIFLLATLTVVVSWMAFVKRTSEQATGDPGKDDSVTPDTTGDDAPLFRDDRLSTLSFWHNMLARFDFVEILKRRLEEAELDWSVGRVTIAMLLTGMIAVLILSRFLAEWALIGGVAAAFVPYAYILRVREKRFRRFREAFPDVLDSLARALRAGYPLSAAMEMVGQEAPAAVAAEIKRTAAEANLGRGWARAMENFGVRVPLVEVNLFAGAVNLHSRTGGKLSEVLVGLAENLRESLALQGEVRALAAHGKLTGLILTILPFAIAFMMFIVSPGYMEILFNHPWGKNLIAAALTCLVLAHFIIRKLVDIKP
jgi:tight adherence protein B